MFKNIKIDNWRQFSKVDINFDPRLTILTGANGSGKTTILNILRQRFGDQWKFISVPERDNNSGQLMYKSGKVAIEHNGIAYNSGIVENMDYNTVESYSNIGSIEDSDGSRMNILVPNKVNNTFSIIFTNNNTVPGMFITSHRSIFAYKEIKQIPTKVLTKKDIYNTYSEYIGKYEKDEYRNANEVASTMLIKETLIALATFGYGNKSVVKNNEAIRIFEGYQDILRKVLPDKIGFEQIEIEVPEVVIKTKTGRFTLDTVSGGIASLIELTWQIYMYGELNQNYIVIIDEPENHLHPELQRMLLPNLLEVFPNVQFIVSTHNPFIISSVPNSNVYVLDYDENGKVKSHSLDNINKSGSSNEILRDVLGISSTMPIWVENKVNEIVEKYSYLDTTSENINKMRKELEVCGFDKLIPEAIVKVIEAGEKND